VEEDETMKPSPNWEDLLICEFWGPKCQVVFFITNEQNEPKLKDLMASFEIF
jgi:hypothetical protein